MKFELNELHRNIADEKLIHDIVRVAEILHKSYLQTREYDELGVYNSSTVRKRFGSWKNAMRRANLNLEPDVVDRQRITDDDLIKDVIHVSNSLGENPLSSNHYLTIGKYTLPTFERRIGNWDKVLITAGLLPTGIWKNLSNDDVFSEIERLWVELGRQPSCTDIRKGLSLYSLSTYLYHFGSWRKALESFVAYVNANDDTYENTTTNNTDDNIELHIGENHSSNEPNMVNLLNKGQRLKRTSRTIPVGLRFKIMKRDKFMCCICGRSPAKHDKVELHVDHIIPWADGGETVWDNLQTLCTDCNWGKGKMHMD